MVNTEALMARAQGLGIAQKEIAAKVGISQSALSKKINNVRPMTLEEAEKIAGVLKIEPRFWMGYFFCAEEHNGAPERKLGPIPAMELDGVRFTEEQKKVVRCYRNLGREEQLIIAAILGVFRNVCLKKAGFDELMYDLRIED